METISKILDIYKNEGYIVVLIRGIKKIGRLLFETNSAFWFGRDLLQPLPEMVAKIPVEVNLSSRDETINWLKDNGEPWMFNQHEIKIGLKEKHYFPNVRYQGKIIGYAKAGVGKVYIQDYKKVINFPDKVAFIYDTYILPEYRGLNIAPFLITEIMKFLKNNGVKKLGCHIPPWNIASINSYTKVGFKKIKYIRYFRIFGLKFFTSDPRPSFFNKKVAGNSGSLFYKSLIFIKTKGLWEFIKKVIKRMRCSIFELRVGILLYKYLDDPIPNVQPKIKLSIKKMTLTDLSQLKDIIDENKLKGFKNRLENKRIGFVAHTNDQVTHYSWVSFDDEYESWLGLKISVDKRIGYLFDGYTISAYRGKGIYPAVLSEQLRYLKEQGRPKAIILIGSKNYASLRAAEKLGFQKEKTFKQVKICGFKFPVAIKQFQRDSLI